MIKGDDGTSLPRHLSIQPRVSPEFSVRNAIKQKNSPAVAEEFLFNRYPDLEVIVYAFDQFFNVFRRPARGFHTQMNTHFGQHFFDLV